MGDLDTACRSIIDSAGAPRSGEAAWLILHEFLESGLDLYWMPILGDGGAYMRACMTTRYFCIYGCAVLMYWYIHAILYSAGYFACKNLYNQLLAEMSPSR